MEQYKKINFSNETNEAIVIMLKGVLPIFFNQKLDKEKVKNIPKNIRKENQRPLTLRIPEFLQRNFYTQVKTIDPKMHECFDLRPIKTKDCIQDLHYATHFKITTKDGKQKSDDIAIENGAHYELTLLASDLLIRKKIENGDKPA